MVARDIPHEQATELVKGRETLVDQCRRCRQAWPCEVKVLQEENAALRGQVVELSALVRRVSPDPESVADAVGSTDDEPFFEGTPSEVQGVTGEPFGAND